MDGLTGLLDHINMGKICNGREFLTPRRIITGVGLIVVFVLGILFSSALVECLGP